MINRSQFGLLLIGFLAGVLTTFLSSDFFFFAVQPQKSPSQLSSGCFSNDDASRTGGSSNESSAALPQAPPLFRGARVYRSLHNLARKYGWKSLTDKFTIHDYGPMYEKVLEPYMGMGAASSSSSLSDSPRRPKKLKPFKYFEIGLGCVPYYFTEAGMGYRFIKHYAPHVDYYGLDIIPCNFSHLGKQDEAYLRDRVMQASQTDVEKLSQAVSDWGPFDVIVDDGSHQSVHIIKTFLYLFQRGLKPGGVFCIEDLSAAYIPMGGHNRSAQVSRRTSVNFIQHLIAQMHFPFHWVLTKNGTRKKAFPLFFTPFVHPNATFPISKVVRWIRSIDCDREICCIVKNEVKHRFDVPCDEDFCRIPEMFIRA